MSKQFKFPFDKPAYQCACGMERPQAESVEEAVRLCVTCDKTLNRATTELRASFKSTDRLRVEAVEELMKQDYDDL